MGLPVPRHSRYEPAAADVDEAGKVTLSGEHDRRGGGGVADGGAGAQQYGECQAWERVAYRYVYA